MTSIAKRLTMRAEIERDTAAESGGAGNWGQPPEPLFTPHACLKCFAWSPTATETQDGNKLAGVTDVRLLLQLSADVRDGDEVAQITNTRGVVLFAGRYRVLGEVQFKHTHLECNLKKVG
jgi:hypothetical protein